MAQALLFIRETWGHGYEEKEKHSAITTDFTQHGSNAQAYEIA